MNILLFLLACLSAAAGQDPAAFREIGVAARVPSYLLDPTVLRVRPAILNRALFDASAARKLAALQKRNASATVNVGMNVFPDVILPVRWIAAKENEQGGIVWTGSVEDARNGHAVLIVSGPSITGNITRGDGKLYQIRTAEDGTVWLREIDQRKFPDEGRRH